MWLRRAATLRLARRVCANSYEPQPKVARLPAAHPLSHDASHDAGDRQTLLDALGQPFRSWDSRTQRFSFTYDTLRRPVDRTVSVNGAAEKLLGRVVYGDLLGTPTTTNHAGRVYRV